MLTDNGLFFEFVPADDIDAPRRRATGSGLSKPASIRASCCSNAGLVRLSAWRHGPVRRREPAAAAGHRPAVLHAVGVRRTPDRRGDRPGDVQGGNRIGAAVAEYTVSPVFPATGGARRPPFIVELPSRPPKRETSSPPSWMRRSRTQNADYAAHRAAVRRAPWSVRAARQFRALDAPSWPPRRTEQGAACRRRPGIGQRNRDVPDG